MSEKSKTDADLYGNNCLRYEHLEGCDEPESAYSCRGCKHSCNPNLYDGGCKHPDGLLECSQLTAAQQRRVRDAIRKVNDAHRTGHPPDAEYR